ncbi:hypothetical protein EVG20_g9443 [Dentipellis fragilis]|uniref:Uncharacterized protein n=1 Tax=Dentipellis fragilis TaxID=205917 RepID=A0A4Y9Y133_9AGAM|nr:hypothetical protein EVG20_g9443 [Dentipellis fragilis]
MHPPSLLLPQAQARASDESRPVGRPFVIPGKGVQARSDALGRAYGSCSPRLCSVSRRVPVRARTGLVSDCLCHCLRAFGVLCSDIYAHSCIDANTRSGSADTDTDTDTDTNADTDTDAVVDTGTGIPGPAPAHIQAFHRPLARSSRLISPSAYLIILTPLVCLIRSHASDSAVPRRPHNHRTFTYCSIASGVLLLGASRGRVQRASRTSGAVVINIRVQTGPGGPHELTNIAQ